MNPITNMTEKMIGSRMNRLAACAAMLEKYVGKFPAATGTVKLEGKDMQAWTGEFYPSLVESGPQLPDNLFFDPSGKKKNYGIGTDGEFSSAELFQFLYRLYKCMYELKEFKV